MRRTILVKDREIKKNKNYSKKNEKIIIEEIKNNLIKKSSLIKNIEKSDRDILYKSDNKKIKERIREVYNEEKKKIEDLILKKLNDSEKKEINQKELIDGFFNFCLELKKDKKYKESVLFATLFYYYLKKKGKI